MLTRSDIEKDLRKLYGSKVGFLSEAQIKEYTCFGRDRLKTFLLNVPHWGNGRGKRYAIIDIAEKLALELRGRIERAV